MAGDKGMVVGSIDIITAIAIFMGSMMPVYPDLLITMAAVLIVKALWQFFTSNFKNPSGWLDILAAIILILFYYGTYHWLFLVIGFFMLVKGGYEFVTGFTDM